MGAAKSFNEVPTKSPAIYLEGYLYTLITRMSRYFAMEGVLRVSSPLYCWKEKQTFLLKEWGQNAIVFH